MVTKQSTNTLTHNLIATEGNPTAKLSSALATLHGFAKTAAKNGFKLGAHRYYSAKASECLTGIRRAFLEMRHAYPADRFPEIAKQFDEIEGPLHEVERGLLKARLI